MPDTLQTSIVIGAALSAGFGVTTSKVNSSIGEIGKTVKATKSQLNRLGDYSKLGKDTTDLAKQVRVARSRVGELGRELSSAEKPTKAMQRAFQKAKTDLGKLESKLDSNKGTLRQWKTEMSAAGVKVGRTSSETKRLTGDLGKLETKLEKHVSLSKKMKRNLADRESLRGQVFDTVAMGMAFATPIRSAIRFESVMADVGKVVNFKNPAGLKAMGGDLLKLSTQIPMTAGSLGEIMAAAGQAGIARAELMRFTEDASKMGVAFDMSGAQAGGAMTGMRSIFKLNQDQVVQLGDSYNHLSNNMDATARDMLNIANRAGSTAKLVGLTGQEVGALGATFLALKTPPEVAATGINAMLLKLSTADKQGKKFQSALAGMGYSARELKQRLKQDAQGTLLEFLETVKRSPDVTGTLADLFGAEYADDVAKLVGSMDTYRKALNLVGKETNYAGSMNAEYQARAATAGNSLQLFKNQVERVGVTLGSVLLPTLTTVMGHIGSLVSVVATFADQNPVVTQAIVGIVAGLVTMRIAVVALSFAGKNLSAVFLTTKSVWRAVPALATKAAGAYNLFASSAGRAAVKERALGKAMKARGFLSKIGGKGGVAGAAVMGALAIGSTMMAGDSMTAEEKAGNIGGAVGGMGGAAAGAMAGAALGSVVPIIGTALGGLIGSIIGGLGGDWLGESLGKMLLKGASAITRWAGNVKASLGETWVSIKAGASSAWAGIGSWVSRLGSLAGGTLDVLTGLPGQILGLFASLPQQMFEAGGDVIGGLIGGIKSKAGALKDSVLGVGSGIVDWFKGDQEIKSPSRVWAGMGGHLMGGLAQGIDKRGGLALASMAGLTAALVQPLPSMAAPDLQTVGQSLAVSVQQPDLPVMSFKMADDAIAFPYMVSSIFAKTMLIQ